MGYCRTSFRLIALFHRKHSSVHRQTGPSLQPLQCEQHEQKRPHTLSPVRTMQLFYRSPQAGRRRKWGLRGENRLVRASNFPSIRTTNAVPVMMWLCRSRRIEEKHFYGDSHQSFGQARCVLTTPTTAYTFRRSFEPHNSWKKLRFPRCCDLARKAMVLNVPHPCLVIAFYE